MSPEMIGAGSVPLTVKTPFRTTLPRSLCSTSNRVALISKPEIAELQRVGFCRSGQIYGIAFAVFEVKGIDPHRFGNKRHVRIAIPISKPGRGHIERSALQVDEAIEGRIVGSSFHSHVELRRAHDIPDGRRETLEQGKLNRARSDGDVDRFGGCRRGKQDRAERSHGQSARSRDS